MMDNSREGLMQVNKKSSIILPFESILEQQEEMSGSSNNKNSPARTKYSNKNLDDITTKNIFEEEGIIRHSQTHKNKLSWTINKNKDSSNKEDNKLEENCNKNSLPKHKKKIIKRHSVEEKRKKVLSSENLNETNKSEAKIKKGSLGKQVNYFFGSLNNSLSHQLNSLSNNIQDQSFNRHKSISNFVLDYNKINKKQTVLHKEKLNFNEKTTTTSIYDQIKKSESYEKSESLIFQLKICFAILAVFSLISIILSLADSILYNNKSFEYIRTENNNTHFNKKDIEYYYCINKRKISYRENSIRIANAVFSFLCFLIVIVIYKIKIGDFVNKKNSKREKFKRMLREFYNKRKKKDLSKNNKSMPKEEKGIEKMKVLNFSEVEKKQKINEKYIRIEREIAIKVCIMNIIFYPPYINIAFIGQYGNIIYIYSLNYLFLIISLLKISNIYRAIFYLSPLNNSFNKAICRSNLLNLNTKFMFRYNLNKAPLTFLTFNFIIIFISICLVLACVEFFSIDIKNDFWSNINENRTENFFNILMVFLHFGIKNIHEDHCIKTVLGKIILLLGGLVGMAISSYFIFYLNNSVEFSREEQMAFSKLQKLLKPTNKEHKAANLIKSVLLAKKTFIDNQNTVKDYKLKMGETIRPKNVQRRPIFSKKNALEFDLLFNNSNRSSQNRLNLNESNTKEEKKELMKYIASAFLFKLKVKVELKNFTDKLKIARDSSLSFKDVLKEIGNKLDANTTQLNNKIEVLIRNDNKYLNFIKFTSNSLKKIQKITDYHDSIIQYLTEIHNEHIKQIIEIKKDIEANSPYLFKNTINIPKRVKSNAFAIFTFKSRRTKKFGSYHHGSKKKKKKELYDLISTKISVKKQKSSQVSSLFMQNNYLDERLKRAIKRKNTNKHRSRKSISKRTKSMEEWKYIVSELKEKSKGRFSYFDKNENNDIHMNDAQNKK